jgi:hypothetical protein
MEAPTLTPFQAHTNYTITVQILQHSSTFLMQYLKPHTLHVPIDPLIVFDPRLIPQVAPFPYFQIF